MSVALSTFYKKVQRNFNDYTPYTLSLILERLNERVMDMEDRLLWGDLLARDSFTAVPGTALYTMSAYTQAGSTENLRGIVNRDTLLPLENLTIERYNQLGLATDNNRGTPTKFVALNDQQFLLYPIPSAATVLNIEYNTRHRYLTADAAYFSFSDDKVWGPLFAGVVADIYLDKGDTRSTAWERKYELGLKRKKANQKKGLRGTGMGLRLGKALD